MKNNDSVVLNMGCALLVLSMLTMAYELGGLHELRNQQRRLTTMMELTHLNEKKENPK